MPAQRVDLSKVNDMQQQQQQQQHGRSYSTPKRGTWSPEEDRRLLELVDQTKVIKWVEIAEQLGTRTSKQCRERYHQKLKPSLSHEPISSAESEQIERLVALYGKRWALIARHLKGRSDNVIKNWWNASLNRRRLTSVHLVPLNSPRDSDSHPQILSQSALTSPNPSYFDSASSSSYDDPGQVDSSDFATRILNNHPRGQLLDARPDAQRDYDFNSSQDTVPSELSRSPLARNNKFFRDDRMNMVAPPSIGVAFNPLYASDGSSTSEISCESNGSFNSATQHVPRSDSTVSSSTQSMGLPYANNEQFRSPPWSEFGIYSGAELAKNTPSRAETLSLKKYSLSDPSFSTNFERRSTVCHSQQLPSLFRSTSYLRPSFGSDNNSENNSSASDSSSAVQSSQAPSDFCSCENSGSSSQSETHSSESLQKPAVSQQQTWPMNQTIEISGRAKVPFGDPEGVSSSVSGSLGGPPGGLPALTSYGQRIEDARCSHIAQKDNEVQGSFQPAPEEQAQVT